MKLIQFITSKFWDTKSRRFIGFAKYFSLFSIIIGVVSLLLSLAVLEGYDKTLRTNAIRFTSHIIIQPFNRSLINDYPQLMDSISNYSNEIRKLYPIIQSEVLIKNKENTEGIALRGVRSDYLNDRVCGMIKAGNCQLTDEKGIVLGYRLAKRLNTSVGDSVHLFFLQSNSVENINYKAGKFAVKGIFQSQMAQYDDLVAYGEFNVIQKLMGLDENQSTNIELIIDDVTKSAQVGNELEKFLGYPYYALTVFDLHRSVFSWIELQKEPIPIILGLISIIAAFNIITTLLILILEKIRQIGILRSLGMTKRHIVGVFVFAGVRLAMFGLFIGAVLSFVLSVIQKEYGIIRLNGEIYFLDVLPVEILPFHYVIVILLTFVLSFLATLIPSMIASRVKIVNALRFK